MNESRHKNPETSSTLLRDLRDTGDAARWAAFERAYRPFVYRILVGIGRTHPGLLPDMFEDVMQETLIALMKKFPDFEYDRDAGTFRGYLRGIVGNKAMAVAERRWRRGMVVFNSDVLAAVEEHPENNGNDAVAERLDMAREIWRLLMRRTFDGRKYTRQSQEIFYKLISGKNTAGELAQQYGMERNAVYQLKNRVLKDIKAGMKAVEHGSGDLLNLLETLLREEAENGKC